MFNKRDVNRPLNALRIYLFDRFIMGVKSSRILPLALRFNSLLVGGTLLVLTASLCATGCHLISPEENAIALSATPEDKLSPECAMTKSDSIAWWEGKWRVDIEKLNARMINQHQGDSKTMLNPKSALEAPIAIESNVLQIEHALAFQVSQSIATSFALQISTQQATLQLDQSQRRLATSPLPNFRGVKLVGSQSNSALWCEGSWGDATLESLRRLVFLPTKIT